MKTFLWVMFLFLILAGGLEYVASVNTREPDSVHTFARAMVYVFTAVFVALVAYYLPDNNKDKPLKHVDSLDTQVPLLTKIEITNPVPEMKKQKEKPVEETATNEELKLAEKWEVGTRKIPVPPPTIQHEVVEDGSKEPVKFKAPEKAVPHESETRFNKNLTAEKRTVSVLSPPKEIKKMEDSIGIPEGKASDFVGGYKVTGVPKPICAMYMDMLSFGLNGGAKPVDMMEKKILPYGFDHTVERIKVGNRRGIAFVLKSGVHIGFRIPQTGYIEVK